MLQAILLTAMILISLALTGVILLQRSEGGALGMGGGPSGFMTARGAGNLLTRSTAILGVLFFACALALTIVGNIERGSQSIIDAGAVGSIDVNSAQPQAPAQPAPTTPGLAPPPTERAPSLDDLGALQTAPAQPAPAPAPAQ